MTSRSAVFLRLTETEDKDNHLLVAIDRLLAAEASPILHLVDASVLGQIPGSPLAYWVTDKVRGIFHLMPKFQHGGRSAQFGASTKNDFRYLRAWWETLPEYSARSRPETLNGKRWVPFAKGGSSLPFYRDFELAIDWADDGAVLKQEISKYRGSRGWGYHWTASLNGHTFYFRPGLTWSRRASTLSFRVLPSGCIFGDKGPSALVTDDSSEEILALVGLMNSRIFNALVELMVARVSLAQSFEVGLIQMVPVPELAPQSLFRFSQLSLSAVDIRRRLDSTNELSHAFHRPALVACGKASVIQLIAGWERIVGEARLELENVQSEIDEDSYYLYRVSQADKQDIEASHRGDTITGCEGAGADEIDETEADVVSIDRKELVADLLSYLTGVIFGRWDIRITGEPSLKAQLQGPFDPLPVCAPAMLVGSDGLPARTGNIVSEEWLRARPDVISLPPEGSVVNPTIRDDEYPLRIDWDGILVDDPFHQDDVVNRLRDVLTLLWGDRAEAIEQEACDILGVRHLREWFHNPKRFWDFHVKRYSKSRRKAPIYWLLQSSKRSYGIWLYYHRMDGDILFKALRYVNDRLALEHARLEEALAAKAGLDEAEARTRRQAEQQIEGHEAFLSEVTAFRDELAHIADLGLTVEHDDGVLLSIAPLHTLVPWAPAKAAWNELVQGKYEWSGISQQMRARDLLGPAKGRGHG